MQEQFNAILVSTGPEWKKRAKHHFLEIVKEHGNAANLILFPGWTFTRAQFDDAKDELAAALQVKARVLWEVGASKENGKKKELGELYSNQDSILKSHGKQRFTGAKDVVGQKALMDAVYDDKEKEERWVHVGNRRFFWLNCGEVLLLKSPRGAEEVAEPRPKAKAWFETIMAQADGFLNPGHTLFGRTFLTPKHGRYLSASGRLFLRTVCHTKSGYASDDVDTRCSVAYHDGEEETMVKRLGRPSDAPYVLCAVKLLGGSRHQ